MKINLFFLETHWLTRWKSSNTKSADCPPKASRHKIKVRDVLKLKMVETKSDLFYFPHPDNAIFQPSKIKDNNDIF